jgi:acetolactate synthase-1/2/3 large subunit
LASSVRVADYVLSFVASRGTKAVFLVPGGGSMYLVDAAGQSSLRVVPNHHEQASAIAAEAYARVSGKLGCAIVTTGPGATNAITGVAGAWIESIPVLILSGQVKRADLMVGTGLRQKGPQEVDIISMVKSITKYAVTVMDPADIRYHLEKAAALAMSGRKGPVWLDIPLDVQAAQIEPEALRGFEQTPELVCPPPLQEEDIAQIVSMLNAAERPIILAGHGIRLAGAAATFTKFYQRLNIPVATTWNASDLIALDDRLSVGNVGSVALRAGNFAVQNSDLILAIGARLDNIVTAFSPANFGRTAKKVVVDIDPAELAKFDSESNFVRKIHADAGNFMEAMLADSRLGSPVRSDWLTRCSGWKRRYPINDGKPFPAQGPISHYHLTKVLSDEIQNGELIVTGSSGLAVEFFHAGFGNKSGQRILITCGLGAMGYGLPAAIGASVAYGDKPFVGIEGDGSFMMNVQELQTIRSQQIPVRMFVFNNYGYASIRNTQRSYFSGRFVGTHPEAGLGLPDLVALSIANGIPASRVSDASELRDMVRYVLSQPGPYICDVIVRSDEPLWPKVAALPRPDGSITSMPLEDMSPLLPREELRSNMIDPLDPASENAADQVVVEGATSSTR